MSVLDGGTLQPVPPNAPSATQIQRLNDVINTINSMLKTQVFSDATSRRMLIGYQANGWGSGKDFGIKVSVPGVDVLKANDDQLLFKMDISTWYFYDPNSRNNFMQLGVLPDGTGGFAVADVGKNVSEGF